MKKWFSRMEKRLRCWIYGDQATPNVERASEASHALANEVTQLNAVTRQIRQSANPWEELVKAVRGNGLDDNHHEARH